MHMLGMISLTLSAVLPQLRPPPCDVGQVCQEADAGQVAILYISLLLTALGSGGIRPCVVAFGADQFDEMDPKQSTKTWNYFNWYYFVMGVSILVAVTVLVYIQDTIGWGWGLGVPTIAMFISIVVFIIGYPRYRNLDPAGSPFTRLLQVVVAAYRKRKLPMVSDPKLLYQNDDLDASISMSGKLLHAKQMKEHSLKEAASRAYQQACAPYHCWSVRTAVAAGMCTLPARGKLLLKLKETDSSAEKKMRRYISVADKVIEYIDNLYLSKNISLNW